MIMSSSTPKEWSKSSTVLDIIGGPHKYSDVLWSVVLLEVGVAHYWSNEAWSILHAQCISLRIWTVQSQVEVEVRELLLQLQEVFQEEYLINCTSAIEVVHLAIGSLTISKSMVDAMTDLGLCIS